MARPPGAAGDSGRRTAGDTRRRATRYSRRKAAGVEDSRMGVGAKVDRGRKAE